MSAFARALRALPATICDNAGLDSAEIVANLRAAHAGVLVVGPARSVCKEVCKESSSEYWAAASIACGYCGAQPNQERQLYCIQLYKQQYEQEQESHALHSLVVGLGTSWDKLGSVVCIWLWTLGFGVQHVSCCVALHVQLIRQAAWEWM
jgi:hypothetical protein